MEKLFWFHWFWPIKQDETPKKSSRSVEVPVAQWSVCHALPWVTRVWSSFLQWNFFFWFHWFWPIKQDETPKESSWSVEVPVAQWSACHALPWVTRVRSSFLQWNFFFYFIGFDQLNKTRLQKKQQECGSASGSVVCVPRRDLSSILILAMEKLFWFHWFWPIKQDKTKKKQQACESASGSVVCVPCPCLSDPSSSFTLPMEKLFWFHWFWPIKQDETPKKNAARVWKCQWLSGLRAMSSAEWPEFEPHSCNGKVVLISLVLTN